MAPICRCREEEKEAQAAQMRADALRLLAIARGEDPGDGAAVEIRLEDGMVVMELARPPSQDDEVEDRHAPFEVELLQAMEELERDVPLVERLCGWPLLKLHTAALSEGLHEMRALPDPRYDVYSWDFFKAYRQSPRPIDPPAASTVAGYLHVQQLGARYPYLADEVARLTRLKTAEQREALGRGLLQVDAAKLASLEERFREAVWAGKEAMVAKLQAEVRYAKARLQAEAMAEKIKAAGRSQ